MNTPDLQETVEEVVEDFMLNGMLFTALDVSNAVKKVIPTARHRQVRDEVRARFADMIEPNGWARTPITVTLADGSTAEALLYHPLADSWDLDSKYDTQKRTATSLRASTNGPQTVGSDPVSSLADAVKYLNSQPFTNAANAANNTTPAVAPVAPPAAPEPPLTVWEKLCNSTKSFFGE